jgi:hypothetical protein
LLLRANAPVSRDREVEDLVVTGHRDRHLVEARAAAWVDPSMSVRRNEDGPGRQVIVPRGPPLMRDQFTQRSSRSAVVVSFPMFAPD